MLNDIEAFLSFRYAAKSNERVQVEIFKGTEEGRKVQKGDSIVVVDSRLKIETREEMNDLCAILLRLKSSRFQNMKSTLQMS